MWGAGSRGVAANECMCDMFCGTHQGFLAGPGQKRRAESSGRLLGGRCGAGAGRGVEQSRVEGWEQRGRWCSRGKIWTQRSRRHENGAR